MKRNGFLEYPKKIHSYPKYFTLIRYINNYSKNKMGKSWKFHFKPLYFGTVYI